MAGETADDDTGAVADPGLLFVLSEPGTGSGDADAFHDWYDHEHVPARTAFPQITHATRWAATDEASPGWLATYDVDLPVLADPAYTVLRERRSERERAVIATLRHFERRTYRQLLDVGRADDTATVRLVAVSLDVADDDAGAADELASWYAEEHVPMLQRDPAWRRTRRFELLDAVGGASSGAPRWLALHELDDAAALTTASYAEATSTPRRAAVMARVTRRERRVFTPHRRF